MTTIQWYTLFWTAVWGFCGIAGLVVTFYAARHALRRLAKARVYTPFDPMMVILARGKVWAHGFLFSMFLLMALVLVSSRSIPPGDLRTAINTTLIGLLAVFLLALAVKMELTLREAEKVNGYAKGEQDRDVLDAAREERHKVYDTEREELQARRDDEREQGRNVKDAKREKTRNTSDDVREEDHAKRLRQEHD